MELRDSPVHQLFDTFPVMSTSLGVLYSMRKNAIQYVEVTCAATGERFMKYKKEYDRQIKKGVTRFFKNGKIASAFLGAEKKARRLVTKECPNCHVQFESSTKKKAAVYCSRECAAKHSHFLLAQDPMRRESRSKNVSEGNRRFNQEVRDGLRPSPISRNGLPRCAPEELRRTCVICGTQFQVKYRAAKGRTCSKDCLSKHMSNILSANPNCGGETNYRRYRYKGILMDSQWEVDIAQWMDERGVEWKRDKKMVFRWLDEVGKSRRYHPDFYLPAYDIYLDPKNKYLIEKDRFKIETVMKTHGIKIVWGLKEDVISHLELLFASLT